MELEFMLHAFPLQVDVEKARGKLGNGINFQCNTNKNKMISETKPQDLYPYWPKQRFPL
jgi:hypothetical protein